MRIEAQGGAPASRSLHNQQSLVSQQAHLSLRRTDKHTRHTKESVEVAPPYALRELVNERYPMPSNGHRVLLPPEQMTVLHRHCLSRDLYSLAAGYSEIRECRPRVAEPLPSALLAYCSAGQGELQVGQDVWCVRAGDLIVVPPGTPVYLGPRLPGYWTLHWVMFIGDMTDAYLDWLNSSAPVVPCGTQPRIVSEIGVQIQLLDQHQKSQALIEAAGRFKALLCWLARLLEAREAGPGPVAVERCLAYLQERIETSVTMGELAHACELSKTKLSRQFSKAMGCPPLRYFIELKMRRAAELLTTTDFDICRIGESLGYDDPYYFSRLFKRTLGVAPREYRKAR